ncbi:MAG: VWA domain-containing protein [Burkholderiaceae bacterium]|nr:VWA domain-containing protein [Burkholderiaceae bacterium]
MSAGAGQHALGDARSGKMAANVVGFLRTLRRAGVMSDANRAALAFDALRTVGLASKRDTQAALEAVLVNKHADLVVFRELFDAYFRDPKLANQLLAQMLPTAQGQANPSPQRARTREALSPPKPNATGSKPQSETPIELDAAMTASEVRRIKHADFNTLTASEYHLVMNLAKRIDLGLPKWRARRYHSASTGSRVHWSALLRDSARGHGLSPQLPMRARKSLAPPLVVLVDVSGSMERYTRLLLAFLHAATKPTLPGGPSQRHVFAFGTHLSDLSAAFALDDTDAMLARVNTLVSDFAGGTMLGDSLATLKAQHARALGGSRAIVMVISDGLDTGEPSALDQHLEWLKLHSKRLLWLNPLLRFDQYVPAAQGAQLLHAHSDAMLAVHNVDSLHMLASSIAQLMRSAR